MIQKDFMSKEWFYINNMEEFVNSTRKLVFYYFGDTDKSAHMALSTKAVCVLSDEELKELDVSLTYNESLLIVQQYAKKRVNKHNQVYRYCINEDILYDIIEALNARMVSNILNNLVNSGILESGFDPELDDFVFWIKEGLDINNKENEKPETD